MTFRKFLKITAENFRSFCCFFLHRAKRGVGAADKKIIGNYFKKEGVKKLHLGCGERPLEGWLNSDYFPKSPSVLEMDVTKKFPFNDSIFDYVFCEHLIEHITYLNGNFMLAESFRVLKPGGKIRISTPDLNFLIELYGKEKNSRQTEYVKWCAVRFPKNVLYPEDVFVINNFVRDWGHRFIYDEKTLNRSLQIAGFSNIVRHELNESSDPELRHLENDARMPAGFLKLETFTLEAEK